MVIADGIKDFFRWFSGPVGLCTFCLMAVTGRSGVGSEKVPCDQGGLPDHRAVVQFKQ